MPARSEDVMPKYRVEYQDNTQFLPGGVPAMYPKRAAWTVSQHGKPTDANLEKWRKAHNKCFLEGGVNYPSSCAEGVIIHTYRAWIVEQKTGKWVAETTAPPFEKPC